MPTRRTRLSSQRDGHMIHPPTWVTLKSVMPRGRAGLGGCLCGFHRGLALPRWPLLCKVPADVKLRAVSADPEEGGGRLRAPGHSVVISWSARHCAVCVFLFKDTLFNTHRWFINIELRASSTASLSERSSSNSRMTSLRHSTAFSF